MIRYSSYGSANYRTRSAAQVTYIDKLEAEYRELLELRERVRKAEVAARPLGYSYSTVRGGEHRENSPDAPLRLHQPDGPRAHCGGQRA